MTVWQEKRGGACTSTMVNKMAIPQTDLWRVLYVKWQTYEYASLAQCKRNDKKD